jgi:3-oxoacyl-[acyl-carrier protein] reductase
MESTAEAREAAQGDREIAPVALVMAASKGLGRGCAEALGRRGYRLMVCARRPEGVENAVAGLRALGATAAGMVADVSVPEQLENVFRRADEAYGRLDVLVANAGGPPPGGFMGVTEDQWRSAYELTLMSAVRAIRLAVPRMRASGYGRILIIGSSSVKQPIPGLVLSNAFRPALVGIVKTLAQELAPQGITVNIVSPGRVDTDRVRSLDENRAREHAIPYEEVRRQSERSIPMGRYGEPKDVGELVAFLAGEAAGYITGQSILVDGGMLTSLP